MQRVPEPELMEEAAQAEAYANADFEEPHSYFIELFREVSNGQNITGSVLDLGCGPADISIRFAKAYPDCYLHAMDGSASMLGQGKKRISRENLEGRIQLIHGKIPEFQLANTSYGCIISNSLLHHLHNPDVLWQYVCRYSDQDTFIFVMDLKRPDNTDEACELVNIYSHAEPEILKRDFYNSLCAAFTPLEVKEQLIDNNLTKLKIQVISDRHIIIYGKI